MDKVLALSLKDITSSDDPKDVYLELMSNHLRTEFEILDSTFHKLDGSLDHKVDDEYCVKLTDDELELVLSALSTFWRKLDAEKYIRRRIGKNITGKDWQKVSEIMGIKEDGCRLRKRGYLDAELYCYEEELRKGNSTKVASEVVCRFFEFESQEACNKWLCDELTRKQKEGDVLFSRLKKPKKSPT